jgi:hypothetical protein
MSQRDSGYKRKERDLYETPNWVTRALIPHLPRSFKTIWEPACGTGKIIEALRGVPSIGFFASDIVPLTDCGMVDFLCEPEMWCGAEAIITNPPYELATEFCEHSVRLTETVRGVVAMLLRTDFDHTQGRSHLFRDCPAFAKKLVLTRRITWFEPEPGSKGKSPSFNHAWFIWDWRHEGPPTIGYGP